jgi:hypothetical protein
MSQVATDQLHSHFVWHNGVLHYKERVIIPAESTLRAKLLHQMNDTKVGGHSGVLRTYKKLGQ